MSEREDAARWRWFRNKANEHGFLPDGIDFCWTRDSSPPEPSVIKWMFWLPMPEPDTGAKHLSATSVFADLEAAIDARIAEKGIDSVKEAASNRVIGGELDLDRLRQWFNSLLDLHPRYLEPRDYELADRIHRALGLMPPRR